MEHQQEVGGRGPSLLQKIAQGHIISLHFENLPAQKGNPGGFCAKRLTLEHPPHIQPASDWHWGKKHKLLLQVSPGDGVGTQQPHKKNS